MDQVTLANLDSFVQRYTEARGGELNEETDSEAMFVLCAKYRGAYILTTRPAILWVGVQNATARWTNNGQPFTSVRAALAHALTSGEPYLSAFYSEDSVARMTWFAERIAAYKASGDFLLTAKL